GETLAGNGAAKTKPRPIAVAAGAFRESARSRKQLPILRANCDFPGSAAADRKRARPRLGKDAARVRAFPPRKSRTPQLRATAPNRRPPARGSIHRAIHSGLARLGRGILLREDRQSAARFRIARSPPQAGSGWRRGAPATSSANTPSSAAPARSLGYIRERLAVLSCGRYS